jgi:hypothetical protein
MFHDDAVACPHRRSWCGSGADAQPPRRAECVEPRADQGGVYGAEADAGESVRAVVLTGTDPAFCAGVDLKEAKRDGLKYFEELRSQSCIAAVAKMCTPIVAAINARRSPVAWRWRWAATSSSPLGDQLRAVSERNKQQIERPE